MKNLHYTKLMLSFLLVSLSTIILKAQKHSCGTPPPSQTQIEYTLNKIANLPVEKTAGRTGVALKIHIVRESNGTGGATLEDLAKGLANLNNIFANAGMEFYYKEMPTYVNNSDYYTYNQQSPDNDTETSLKALFTTATDAVNIYVVNTITISGGFIASGYAYFPYDGPGSNVILMTKSALAGAINGTYTHEFGHYFNLFHTHEGTEFGNMHSTSENVARSGGNANCSTKGDLLCDTPADPYYQDPTNFNNGSCTITSYTSDINGVNYVPLINNVMSYYPDWCGGGFTSSQYTRMSQGLSARLGHSTYSIQAPAQSVNTPTGLTGTFNEVTGEIDLTWNDVASNEMGYLIERSSTSSNSGFLAVVSGGVGQNENSFSDTTVDPSTTYWYRIKPVNGNKDTYGNVEQVESGLVFCPAGSQVCDEFVKRVQINTIDNTSICGDGGYQSFSNLTTDVTKGSNTPITITNGTTSWPTDECGIFIDWNQDGKFDGTGENVANFTGSGPYNTNISPPAGAALGKVRMRIRVVYEQTPAYCGIENYGEVEDYSLNVVAALPIDLVSFSVKTETNKINLFWETQTESNNKVFEIERWNERLKTFNKIGELAGAGNSTVLRRYQFPDYHPVKGTNLYRLKQIDFDGSFSYSDAVSAQWRQEEELSLYPNPANDKLNLRIPSSFELPVQYSIINSLGQVQSSITYFSENSTFFEVDISTLPSGVYYIKLENTASGNINGQWFTKH